MNPPHSITKAGQTLLLYPERAIFWKETRMLLVSDLHLGKSHHFQKQGIPLPGGFQERTLDRLRRLIEKTEATRLFFLGDLFHSKYNREWQDFQVWLEELTFLSNLKLEEIRLIKGNHDILPNEVYERAGLQLSESWSEGPFMFIHDKADKKIVSDQAESICFSGHKHPGIRLKIGGRQSVTLPCFHLNRSDFILPAFGDLTGMHLITHQREDEVFAIAENEIIEIPHKSSSVITTQSLGISENI